MKSIFIKYIFNPLYWRIFRKSKRFNYYNKQKKEQWSSLENNITIQKEKLFNLIKYVDKNVEYYHNIIKKNKIKYSRNTIFSDIKKFPILTKDIIRKDFNDLKSFNFSNKYYQDTSGGSTGEPVKFLQDYYYQDNGFGSKILFNDWSGRKEGQFMIKLWGSERDVLQGGIGLRGKLTEILTNVKILNSFRMSKNDMDNYIKIINKKKPVMIETYVQSIYELSKYIKENNLKIYSPKGIITSAGTLYPEMKELIKEVFKCKVLNRYGSREVGDMACSCEKDEGLHLNIFNHYIEILDKDLNPTKPGEIGDVYVTTLNNRIMPLIRYKIGDIVVPTNKVCSCGRGLPLIESVKGRDNSMIKTNVGIIDSTALTTSFYNLDSIKNYQFVQNNLNDFDMYVVIKDKEKWSFDKVIIRRKLRKILGEVNLRFHIRNRIPENKSGKHMYIISKIK